MVVVPRAAVVLVTAEAGATVLAVVSERVVGGSVEVVEAVVPVVDVVVPVVVAGVLAADKSVAGS